MGFGTRLSATGSGECLRCRRRASHGSSLLLSRNQHFQIVLVQALRCEPLRHVRTMHSPAADEDAVPADCLPVPAITCPSPLQCAAPGAAVQLAGSCAASNGAVIEYFVAGAPTTSAACPISNGTVRVSARPSVAAKPNCVYKAKFAYELQRELTGFIGRRVSSQLRTNCRQAVRGTWHERRDSLSRQREWSESCQRCQHTP